MSTLALFDTDIALEWAGLLIRWTHVIAGICWIGSSFYFMALDAELKPNARLDPRVRGDAWQVHGGGFYHIEKYMVAPEFMPHHLTWFKWEAYSTWIFGFALLCVTYFANPTLYLIDPTIADISPTTAILVGALSLPFGYLIYDLLCRSPLGHNQTVLAACGWLLLVGAIYGYTHIFGGQGAYIEVGALVGTIMVANVFAVIMPGQRKTVAALLEGKVPDPIYGKQAKQRSAHNNYLTLPVVFIMLSGHYAITYMNRWSWVVLSCIFVAGFLVRHWFNVYNSGAKPDWRLWPAAAVPVVIALLLSVTGQSQALPTFDPKAPVVKFSEVNNIITERCSVCHVLPNAPRGIVLESPEDIVRLAPKIYLQAVVTRAMPLANATGITDDEREVIRNWVAQGGKKND